MSRAATAFTRLRKLVLAGVAIVSVSGSLSACVPAHNAHYYGWDNNPYNNQAYTDRRPDRGHYGHHDRHRGHDGWHDGWRDGRRDRPGNHHARYDGAPRFQQHGQRSMANGWPGPGDGRAGHGQDRWQWSR